MAEDSSRGRFIWHELMTPNPEGARNFYSAALGWSVERLQEQDPSYSMFAASSGPLAGCAGQSPSAAPRWVPFVTVADVDDALREAADLGARVTVEPTAIESGGRYAVLADPQGATIGIYSSDALEPESDPRPGEFSWHELATSDCRAAFDFYCALFGWENVSEHDMGAMGIYLIFGRDGKQIGGMFNKGGAGISGVSSWMSYVRVEDLRGTVEKIEAGRGSLLTGPMEVPGGDWIAQLLDPYGAAFALHAAAADMKAADGRATSGVGAKVDDSAQDNTVTEIWTDSPEATAESSAREPSGMPSRETAEKASRSVAGKKASKTSKKKTSKKTSKKAKAAKAKATKKKASKKATDKTTKKKAGGKKSAKKKTSKKKTAKKKTGKKTTTKKKAAKKKGTKRKPAKKAPAGKAGKKKRTTKTGSKKAKKKAGKKRSAKPASSKRAGKPGKKTSKRSGGAKAGKKKAGKKARKKSGRR